MSTERTTDSAASTGPDVSLTSPSAHERPALEAEVVTTDAGQEALPESVRTLVDAVQRAARGRVGRVALHGRPPLGFTLTVDGHDGPLVLKGNAMGAVLTFRAARFSFHPGSDDEDLLARITAVVDDLVADRIVLLEEPTRTALRRTRVVRTDGVTVQGVLDTLTDRGARADTAQWCSFGGTWSRQPQRAELRAVDAFTGGTLGKLKRAVFEKVFDGVLKRVDRALTPPQPAPTNAEAAAPTAILPPAPDDGTR